MNEYDLKQRTKTFALNIIHLVEELDDSTVKRVIGYQLMKSGTSVGANYRAVCRAKSRADFAAKLAICDEEADESAIKN